MKTYPIPDELFIRLTGRSSRAGKDTLFRKPGIERPDRFGLHLVRDLAKAIRYTISVDSQPGSGTTFILAA